ncbi:MAG: hypothetical protein VB111_10850, partial [Clostridiaceae bacterium]|nr:hypothetical protein [Clostridiaceae bacterium]
MRDVPFDGTGTYGAVDGDGNYYLYTAGKIFSFSADAKLRYSLDCAGFSGFARASDGMMLLLASDTKGTKLSRIDGAGRLETLLPCTFSGIAGGDGVYDLYGYDRVLYGISLDTGEMTPLCRFAELDIIANDVIAVQTTGVCEDGSPKFACYASSGSKILLCTVEKTARAAKKTLTLGVLSV